MGDVVLAKLQRGGDFLFEDIVADGDAEGGAGAGHAVFGPAFEDGGAEECGDVFVHAGGFGLGEFIKGGDIFAFDGERTHQAFARVHVVGVYFERAAKFHDCCGALSALEKQRSFSPEAFGFGCAEGEDEA